MNYNATHRAGDTESARLKVVVIGCGLAGITTAYFLRRLGARVTVIDRAAGPARETSFANGSMITPSLADPWNAPGVLSTLIRSIGRADAAMLLRMNQLPRLLRWGGSFVRNSSRTSFERSFLHNVRFSLFSQRSMREILQTNPFSFDYAPDGILKVFSEHASLTAAVKTGHWLKQAGIVHEVMTPAELIALEPALGPIERRLVGAVRYPGDEIGNARVFCESLKQLLADDGVEFRFSEQILGFKFKRRHIDCLLTPRGELAADKYVLAAGSYSAPLAKRLKFRVPVVPAKGYSISVPLSDERAVAPSPDLIPRHAVVDDHLHAALVPVGNKILRVAGTAEFAGYDTGVRPERIDNLRKLLGRVYPELNVLESELQSWCGLRPMTPDGRPILGPSPYDNLLLNTGHGALGWTMACGSGRVVAELAMGEPCGHDIEAFSLSRF